MDRSSGISFLLFILVLHYARATFPESELEEDESDRLLKKYMLHYASSDATPRERSSLIRNGLGKYDSLFAKKDSAVSDELDCKIKSLAFEFAQKLNPGVSGSTEELKYIFDGLELGALCNLTFPNYNVNKKKKKHFGRHKSNKGLHVFVDSTYGHNKFHGSLDKPLKDIQTGIETCKELRDDEEQVPCTVNVRKGTYFITKPIEISNSYINLVAYDNEKVIITSDQVVIPQWKLFSHTIERYTNLNPIFEGIKPKQSNNAIHYLGKFDSSANCEIMCWNLTKCTSYAYFDNTTADYSHQCYIRLDGMWNTVSHTGVTSGKKVLIYYADFNKFTNVTKVDQVFINGRRAVRARFPNANPETMGLHTTPTGYVNNAESWLPPIKKPDATEIHIDNPARPASLFSKFYIGLDGPVNQFDPPQSYWGTKNPFGGGGATYRVPTGLKYSADLEINLRKWSNPSTGIVHSYQSAHWGNWMYRLDKRDAEQKSLSWTYGGFQEARGSTSGREWYVENIFEELDAANEWFYDKNERIIYYSPNLTKADLPKQIAIPQLPSLLRIVGSQEKPVTMVKVQGITFQHTTQTFLEPYMVPSGGDWSVHKNGVVYLEGTWEVSVDSCTFDSPGGNGIFVSNFNRDMVLSNNLFYRLGDNGIVLVGNTQLIDGTQGNQPRNIQVLNNLLFENGIWGKQTYPFVQSKSCEVTVDGNVFFNGPRAGVNINDGFGGGNEINNNLLFNFVRETDDHGPINSWDRVPYLTRVSGGDRASLDVKENQIHRNFIINNYRSVWPIDHDDGSCYWNDTHNFLVYGGFKNYLGHDKQSLNNVYVYPDNCVMSAGQSLGTSGYGDIFADNICISSNGKVYALGNCNKNNVRELIPMFFGNRYYTTNNELKLTCGSDTWDLEEMQKIGIEVATVVERLPKDDQVIEWGRNLLSLK